MTETARLNDNMPVPPVGEPEGLQSLSKLQLEAKTSGGGLVGLRKIDRPDGRSVNAVGLVAPGITHVQDVCDRSGSLAVIQPPADFMYIQKAYAAGGDTDAAIQREAIMSNNNSPRRTSFSKSIASRVLERHPINTNHVRNLVEVVGLYASIEEIMDNHDGIVQTLAGGYPAITGHSTISCNVSGPVWLHDVNIVSGVVFGCGALVLPTEIHIEPGSIIWLQNGQLVRTAAQLKPCIIGNTKDGKSIFVE